MPITAVHSYLVHPAKNERVRPAIGGATIAHAGKLFDMLSDIYDEAPAECNIDISFNSTGGQQQNACRDLILAYITTPNIANGRAIAEKLQSITTNRSGLGLLFLILGKEGNEHRFLVSRFPADSGILAEEDAQHLNVEFLEKVFMKNAHTYKAAIYRGTSLKSHFWDGRAIDKQINDQLMTLSNYWIRDFLDSDFKTTSAAGTKRLAVALRQSLKATNDVSIKDEIASAAKLAPGLQNKTTSLKQFARKFQLSAEATAVLRKQAPTDTVFEEQFTFSRPEFVKHIAFQTIELDNGGMLTAEASHFDDVFQQSPVDGEDGAMRFTTEGRVVDRKLKTSKP